MLRREEVTGNRWQSLQYQVHVEDKKACELREEEAKSQGLKPGCQAQAHPMEGAIKVTAGSKSFQKWGWG